MVLDRRGFERTVVDQSQWFLSVYNYMSLDSGNRHTRNAGMLYCQ